MSNLEQIFLDSFIKKINEKQEKERLLSQETKAICDKKRKKLESIRTFLDKFIEQNVEVFHKDKFNLNLQVNPEEKNQPQKFQYYEGDSSESWAPGISIFFDNPADTEIAIHYEYDSKQKIVEKFVVHISSEHPHTKILNNTFDTEQDLCKALAEFLFLNTLSINPGYKNLLKNNINNNNTIEEDKKQININNLKNQIIEEKNYLSKIPNKAPKKTLLSFGLENHDNHNKDQNNEKNNDSNNFDFDKNNED